MFRIAICDDESFFLDIEEGIVRTYLDKIGIESVIDRFKSGSSLLKRIDQGTEYDLAFLDVEMPEDSGMNIAKELSKISPVLRVAFVSAHANYATLGYHVNAVRFILKSAEDIDKYIQECLDHVLKEIEYDNRHEVFDFTCGTKDIYINEILYLMSCKNYVQFVLSDKSDRGIYKIRSSLAKATAMMEKYDFLAISPQVAVNLKHVVSVDRYEVAMNNGEILKIAEKRYVKVNERIMLYKGDKL